METSTSPKKQGQITTSAIWTLASNMTDKFISFFSIGILARLLTPKDFGLVAIAGSIVAFAEILNAFGFDWALVRHPNPTPDHYNTAWTLRVLSGVASVLLMGLIIPISFIFFHQSALLPLISVMALSILVGSFENIGTVDFRRNFTFELEFILRLAAKIAGLVMALTIAYIYHSYWALVLGTLASRFMGTVMSYVLHKFRPRFSLKKMSELLAFSIWMLATNILSFLRTCFANLFIGYKFGSAFTGMYSMANEFANLATSELSAPILRAAYSRYSQHAEQLEELQEDFLSTSSIIWMLALPATAGIFVVSNEIIAVVLGQQWMESSTLLHLLVIGGGLNVILANTYYIYWAMGLSKTAFAFNAFTMAIMIIVSLILATPMGIIGIAISYIVANFLTIPINYYALWKIAGISFAKLWLRVWRICFATFGMLFLLEYLFGNTPVHSSIEALVPLTKKVVSGVVIYTFLLFGSWIAAGMPQGAESFAVKTVKRILPFRKKTSEPVS